MAGASRACPGCSALTHEPLRRRGGRARQRDQEVRYHIAVHVAEGLQKAGVRRRHHEQFARRASEGIAEDEGIARQRACGRIDARATGRETPDAGQHPPEPQHRRPGREAKHRQHRVGAGRRPRRADPEHQDHHRHAGDGLRRVGSEHQQHGRILSKPRPWSPRVLQPSTSARSYAWSHRTWATEPAATSFSSASPSIAAASV